MQGNSLLTVKRCFEVLELVAKTNRDSKMRGLSLKEVTDRTGLNKATAYRYLCALEEYGLLQKNAEGSYLLGVKTVELYHLFIASNDLRTIAYDYMLELSQETQETVYLAIPDGQELLYLERVDSPFPVRPVTQIGGRNPLYSTGLGKAILAHCEQTFINKVVFTNLERRTRNTITDPYQLLTDLELIRKKGFAIDDMENEDQVRCAAAPIFDSSGRAVAGLSVSGVSFRVSLERIEELGPRVREVADAISAKLGWAKRSMSL